MAISSGGGSGGGRGASDVRAGGAWFEVYAKDGLTGVLDKLEAKVKRFASSMQKIGAGMAGAGGALGAGPLGFLLGGISNANEVANLSRQFMVPVEMMSKLKYAADEAGASVEDVLKNPGLYADKLAEAPGMKADDIARAVEVQKEWRLTTLALQNAMLSVLDVIMPLVKMTAEFVRQNAALIVVAGGAGAALFIVGTALATIGAGISLLLSPMGLLLTAGTALAIVFREELTNAFLLVEGTFTMTWKGIGDAVRSGDLKGAFQIAATGIQLVWFQMLDAMGKAFAEWIDRNHNRIVALSSLLGAAKGGQAGVKIGRWFGGYGAGIGGAIGAVGGGLGGGFGADALLDNLKEIGQAGFGGRIAMLQQQLASLTKRAAENVPEAPKLLQLFRAGEFVRGGFNVSGSAAGQFGYGEKAGIAIIQDIRDGKGELPNAIGSVVGGVVSGILGMK